MKPIHISEPPQPTKKQRLLRCALYAVVLAALGVAFLFLFWLVQSPKVLEVQNDPFPVRPPTVARSDVIYVQINYCKYLNVKGDLDARLVGKRSVIKLPYTVDNWKMGCVNREAQILIPEYATDDIYYFEFDVTYQINPVKQQKVTVRSQEFTVRSR